MWFLILAAALRTRGAMLRRTRLSRLTWRAGVRGAVMPRQACKLTLDGLVERALSSRKRPCAIPYSLSCSNGHDRHAGRKLIEALTKVDVHGDVARTHAQDPMTAVLRQRAVQADLMHCDESRGHYVLTGTGRSRNQRAQPRPWRRHTIQEAQRQGNGAPYSRLTGNTRETKAL